MSRIFTFGCSFTQYGWPTWADIILYQNEGYNLGISGSGLESILYRLLEADRVFKLNENDKIIIIFTTPIRMDFIINNQWSGHGQMTTSSYKDLENVIFTVEGLLYKSYYTIKLIDDFLKYRSLNYTYGSVNNINKSYGNYFENIEVSLNTKKLTTHILKDINIELIDFFSYLYGEEYRIWEVTKKYINNKFDYHPRPLDYYNWVNDVLLKKIDIDLKITKDDILKIEDEINNIYDIDHINTLSDKIPYYYNKRVNRNIYIDEK